MLTVGGQKGVRQLLAEMKASHSARTLWSVEFPRWSPVAQTVLELVRHPEKLMTNTSHVRVAELLHDENKVHVAAHLADGTRGIYKLDLVTGRSEIVSVMGADGSAFNPPRQR